MRDSLRAALSDDERVQGGPTVPGFLPIPRSIGSLHDLVSADADLEARRGRGRGNLGYILQRGSAEHIRVVKDDHARSQGGAVALEVGKVSHDHPFELRRGRFRVVDEDQVGHTAIEHGLVNPL